MSKVTYLEAYRVSKANKEALQNNKLEGVDTIGYEYFKNDNAPSPKELQEKRVKGIFAKLKSLGFSLCVALTCSSCASKFNGFTVGTPNALAVLESTEKEKIRSEENKMGLASVDSTERAALIEKQLAARPGENTAEFTKGLTDYLMLRESAKTYNNNSVGVRQFKYEGSAGGK